MATPNLLTRVALDRIGNWRKNYDQRGEENQIDNGIQQSLDFARGANMGGNNQLLNMLLQDQSNPYAQQLAAYMLNNNPNVSAGTEAGTPGFAYNQGNVDTATDPADYYNRRIMEAKKAYNTAKARGNEEYMQLQHDAANRLRQEAADKGINLMQSLRTGDSGNLADAYGEMDVINAAKGNASPMVDMSRPPSSGGYDFSPEAVQNYGAVPNNGWAATGNLMAGLNPNGTRPAAYYLGDHGLKKNKRSLWG